MIITDYSQAEVPLEAEIRSNVTVAAADTSFGSWSREIEKNLCTFVHFCPFNDDAQVWRLETRTKSSFGGTEVQLAAWIRPWSVFHPACLQTAWAGRGPPAIFDLFLSACELEAARGPGSRGLAVTLPELTHTQFPSFVSVQHLHHFFRSRWLWVSFKVAFCVWGMCDRFVLLLNLCVGLQHFSLSSSCLLFIM